MAAKRKKGFSTYILPILFCALLVVLAVLKDRETAQPVKAALQPSEPLTLTDQAIENYLYAAGFTLVGEDVMDGEGSKAARLTIGRDADGNIEGLVLTFPLPTYYETEGDSEILAPLKAKHDAGAQRGEDMFFSLFDAIAATDGRVSSRRDSAATKLRTALDTGKPSTQAANSWRFTFSLEPGLFEGTATINFEKVK